MSNTGILAFGAYVPITRLQRGSIHAANKWFAGGLGGLAKGEKAVACWDEDPITMAVEAARDMLEGRDRGDIRQVMLASTSHTFADRQNAGVVKEALNLTDECAALDTAGGQRAGTSSLLTALQAADASEGQILHLASERRIAPPASEGEMLFGDAAAALLVGKGEPVAKLVASHSVTIDFVDHWRENGADFDYAWEARWIRDEGYGKILGSTIVDALKKAGLSGSDIQHFIVPLAGRGVPQLLGKIAGVPAEAVCDPLTATLGNAGAAHPTLMLSAALETAKPGDKILVSSFGQGADVLIFEVTDAIAKTRPRLGVSGWLARRREDSNYMQYLYFRDLVQPERGARAEFDQKQPATALWRSRKTVFALVGGRCTKTGTVQFPKTELSVNPNDHAQGTQEDYPFADLPAKVFTYTADSLTYTPNPPNFYGHIEFDGGGRWMFEFTDVQSEDVDVGTDMRMMFRIKAKDEQRHFRRYFWKAAPAF